MPTESDHALASKLVRRYARGLAKSRWSTKRAINRASARVTARPQVLAALLEQNAEAQKLLLSLVEHESGPCQFDHHGYCQEHGPSSIPCKVAEARAHLRRAGLLPEVTS